MTPKPPNHSAPQVIVVLGMHRSGTSALMGALHKLGLPLGPKLLPKRQDNRTGFWENSAVVAFNQSVNQTLDRTWHDIPSMPDHWWQESAMADSLDALCSLIREQMGETPHWGLKDPRLCRTLPLWQKAFKKCKLATAYCMMLRHPMEIAASLKKRDGFTQTKSLLLWLDHVLAAESYTRKEQRLWIHYPDLLSEPVAILENLVGELALPWDSFSSAQSKKIEQFLNPKLRNHHPQTGPSSHLNDLCMDLFQHLVEAPESKQTRLLLGRAKRDWQTMMGLISPWLIDQNAHIHALQAEIEAARQAHGARDEIEAGVQAEKAHLEKELYTLSTGHAALLNENAVLRKEQKSDRETLEAALADVTSLQNQIEIAKKVHDDHIRQIDEARTIHGDLQSQLVTAKRVHDEKVAQLRDARKNMSVLEEQIKTSRQNFSSLQQQLEQAGASHLQLTQALDEARVVNDGANQQIEAARDNINLLQDEIAAARSSHAIKDQQLDDAKTNIEKLLADANTARISISQKDAQIDQARDNIRHLAAQIKEARQTIAIKDTQIDQARDNIALLQAEIHQAREAHATRDLQIDQAREHIQQLVGEIETAREHQQLKDGQLEQAHLRRDRLIADFESRQACYVDELNETAGLREALQQAVGHVAQLGAELETAREVHDQKMMEISHAREIHDQKTAEISKARSVHDDLIRQLNLARENIGILSDQVEYARQAHQARDLIESELRREIAHLQASIQPTKRRHGDPSLTPQPEA